MNDETSEQGSQENASRIPIPEWSTVGHAVRRVVNVVGILVLVAVVVPFVIYGAPGVVGADEAFVVLSGSMAPAMQPGDVVVVDDVDAADVERGDVITYASRGSDAPTTHRVIDVRQLESGVAFQTMGDANEDPDPQLVYPQQLVGEVASIQGELFVIPYIGHIIQYGKTPVGFLTLVALPAGLLVVTELVVMVRNARANRRREESVPERGNSQSTDGLAQNGDAGVAAPIPLEGSNDEPAAEASGNGADAATDPEQPAPTESSNTVSISGNDVRATTAVLAVFGTYSAWVAYTNPNAVSITLGVAGVVLLVLCSALLLATRGGASGSGSGGSDAVDGSPATEGATATDGGVHEGSDDAHYPIPLDADDYPDGEAVTDATDVTADASAVATDAPSVDDGRDGTNGGAADE